MTPYLNHTRPEAAADARTMAEFLPQIAERYCEVEDDLARMDLAFLLLGMARTILIATARSADYQDYLQSEWWQRMAQDAKESVGFVCVLCGAPSKEHGGNAVLHAHHVDYSHKGMQRERDDLVVLCADCHARHHGKTP